VIAAGVFAVAWLLLRTGTKPSRLAYPCQQAALSAATLAFGAGLVGAVVTLRRRLSVRWLTPVGILLGSVGAIAALGTWSYVNRPEAYRGPLLDPPRDYVAQVFSQTDCPQTPLGDRFVCVEDLIEKLGSQGIKLHRSPEASLTAGPDGIIAADDVVLLKINYQWPQRGGTNVDLLRGLTRRIVDHPDTFTGEIVVVENTQFASAMNFDRTQNNAEDISLSPLDVVSHFRGQGVKISHFVWTDIRYLQVQEYSVGDDNNGYVLLPPNAQLNGRVSYPKFQTQYGTKISLRNGIWTEPLGYDSEKLKFINLPVLKSHSATYGVTGMTKHYMGVATRELATNSHSSIRYGLMGELMAEIGPADLNILDAIWINANPHSGPSTSYAEATRTDRLVASLDPIAGDLWSAKNILIPAFEDNGYTPPWPYPSADPDDPDSAFRTYLDASMYYLLHAGYEVTNDIAAINAVELGPPGEASDPTGAGAPFAIAKHPGGYELTWSEPFRGGRTDEYVLYATDLSGIVTPGCVAQLGLGISSVLATLPGDSAFVVVARNTVGDGSFGRNSLGYDRKSPALDDVCP